MRWKSTANAPAHFALVALALVACGPTAPATHPAGPRQPPAPEATGSPDAAPPTAPKPAPVEPVAGLGRNNAEAIQVCKPSGETAYLSRLRCADGAAPSYRRVGHGGYRTERTGPDDYRLSADQVRTGRPLEPGEADFHPVDQYTVLCTDDNVVHKLYLDMYHCSENETTAEAPEGFTTVVTAAPATQPSQR